MKPEPAPSWSVRLMSSGADLSDLTETQIVEAVRQARKDSKDKAATKLHRQGWTWEKISAALGASQSAAYR